MLSWPARPKILGKSHDLLVIDLIGAPAKFAGLTSRKHALAAYSIVAPGHLAPPGWGEAQRSLRCLQKAQETLLAPYHILPLH